MKITKRMFVAISILLICTIGILSVSLLSENSRSHFQYVVKQGDTCLDIAYNLGVSIVSIVEANALMFDCSDIYPGQKLNIPYRTSTPVGFIAASQVVVDCEIVFYAVQEGDSVSSIANDYYVPKQAIRDFNGIEADILTPGTEIVIPLCVRTPRYIDPTPTATFAFP